MVIERLKKKSIYKIRISRHGRKCIIYMYEQLCNRRAYVINGTFNEVVKLTMTALYLYVENLTLHGNEFWIKALSKH